ncbi:hypothetical protein CLOM_g11556 [Closterium sp. NIES-68]|nr:hypothetical protein CLOM_g11556 [Closterium sp. NIES-68]GJP64926.1 hypothetical protein CLOP_g21861 [Closterium sp. NIES-67]
MSPSSLQLPLLPSPSLSSRLPSTTLTAPIRRGLSCRALAVRSLIQRHRDSASQADESAVCRITASNQQALSDSPSVLATSVTGAATAAACSASFFLAPAASAVSLDSLASLAQNAAVIAEISPDAASAVGAVLGPLFAGLNFLFILRIVMSWYPQLPVSEFPFIIAYAPTEPILRITRTIIQPIGGVDIAPIVWLALISFLNEILLGQQGLLVLIANQQSLL